MRPRQPFHAEGLLGFLAPRCVPGVEVVEGATYRRAVDGAVLEAVLAPDALGGSERLARAVAECGPDPASADEHLAKRPAAGRRAPVPGA